MENKENKARNLFQKLCSYRLRIDRNGKTVVNWSSLFSLACLILAPHMSIAGIVLLIRHRRSLRVADGGDRLTSGSRFSLVFCRPGWLLYCLAVLGMILFSYLV